MESGSENGPYVNGETALMFPLVDLEPQQLLPLGPRGCTGELVVVIGDSRESLEARFASVEEAATFTCRGCMPYENGLPIWVARGRRATVAEVWPKVKRYI